MTAESVNSTRLPGPAERSQADVVIFDGECGFCTGQVQRINRWDPSNRLAFLSLHDPEVANRYPDLTYDQLMDEMYVVDQKGRRHAGAAAFRYLTRRLPLLWPAALLMHIPFTMPLWHWAYRQVARRRYRLSAATTCDSDKCEIHLGR